MQCSANDLTVLNALAGNHVSAEFGLPLAKWLTRYLAAEAKRRNFETAEYPDDLFENKWQPGELCGILCLSSMWLRSSTSAFQEQFLQMIHTVVIGHVCARLLDYEDILIQTTGV